MNIKFGAVAVLTFFCVSLFGQTAGELLSWSDSTGQYSVVAEFVSLDGDEVTLKKESGEVVKIPLAKLSTDDAARARKLATPLDSKPESPEPVRIGEPTTPEPVRIGEPDDPFDDALEARKSAADGMENEREITDFFPLTNRMELTKSEKVIVEELRDSMETPSKTFLWENVRWFWEAVAGEADLLMTVDGPVVEFQSKKAFFEDVSALIPDWVKLDFFAPLGLIGGYLCLIVCGLWFLIAMFRVSAWWALGYLVLGGLVGLVFLIKYWDEGRRPFLWSCFFVVGIVASFFLFPDWAPEYAVLDQALGYSE